MYTNPEHVFIQVPCNETCLSIQNIPVADLYIILIWASHNLFLPVSWN